MAAELPEGLYEHLVTEALAERLERLEGLDAIVRQANDADVHVALARHLGREIERVLGALPSKDRLVTARELANQLLAKLSELSSMANGGVEPQDIASQHLADPTRELLAVFRGAAPERPSTSISTSTLLTRNRAEPALGHELSREIASADRIDALVAFVTVGGVRALQESLDGFARRGHTRMRLLTTAFTGTTEVAALDRLARLPGVEVRVSFDTRRTRLHAKAWLFHRSSGLSTAYVGSANLTATALGSGHEWMVKVSSGDLEHVIEKCTGTFETLWEDPEFERYHPEDEDVKERLRQALSAERRGAGEERTALIGIRPFPYQEEILDRLVAERELHGRRRNLVVAATGTGKTVIAAFDYSGHAKRAGVRPRLLFLAHRREILEQAMQTFRHALQDGSFGELLTGRDEPSQFEHLFATIQTVASRDLVARLGADHWKHVVVDECHHVPAESYQQVVPRINAEVLVGLTATPERTDGKSLLPDFDGHVAAEMRLWHALDGQLLVPFEYFGISDQTDLRKVTWSRQGYTISGLEDLYTGNDARAKLVMAQLERHVADIRQIRALGFCVSVAHAEFMAKRFSDAGIPALAVHGGSDSSVRAEAPGRLRERDVNVLFTCDLYNEGVDLPFVDTLLLLRPTMSATLFLQQLGRGLRIHDDKVSCLVLDFVGQHRREFRFDAVLSALLGVPRAGLRKAVEDGFPYLPSGCTVHLDRVAREQILGSLKGSIANAKRLAVELSELSESAGTELRLPRFLEETGRDLEDVYTDKSGWRTIRRLAGFIDREDEELEDLSRRLGWLTHIDEPSRLGFYDHVMNDEAPRDEVSGRAQRRLSMLDFHLNHRGVLRAADDVAAYYRARPEIAAEYRDLANVLRERVPIAGDHYPVPDWPLALHRHYQRREIVAAVGFVEPGQKGKLPQGGILKLDGKRELLLVTLDKSGSSFSATTRYRDYAISRDRFHWETQGAASVDRPSGQRYIDPTQGWTFFLFVRSTPNDPYAFMGPVHYQSHTGNRPIAITWRLDHAMPAFLLERYASLASG